MDTYESNSDEYESLPTNNVKTHMLAGAAAGVMEHCIMYPLDSVKVIYAIYHWAMFKQKFYLAHCSLLIIYINFYQFIFLDSHAKP